VDGGKGKKGRVAKGVRLGELMKKGRKKKKERKKKERV